MRDVAQLADVSLQHVIESDASLPNRMQSVQKSMSEAKAEQGPVQVVDGYLICSVRMLRFCSHGVSGRINHSALRGDGRGGEGVVSRYADKKS